ncbi:DNA-directed DNA polymerase [Kluyveromyces marxianus]|nr:DNA-directed DNA polymerase [Kluyveromyces marxianus]KAG0684375.1 DNA-directed DNA polymerase [Kluyveromyces marxianus]
MQETVERVNRDLFYKVASELEKERLEAAIQLINEISSVDPESGAKEWEYVLDRLIKGLASNRGGARLGFSMCLTEVVALALDKGALLSSIDEFLDRLDQTLGGKDGVKNGKEERGLLFGQMFALQALLNEPVFSKVFLTKSNSGLNIEFLLKFLEKLIHLALLKTWLREPCLYSVYQTIRKCEQWLREDPVSIKLILGLLDENKLTLTNEGLSIYLMFNNMRSKYASSLSLKNAGWKNNDPLSKGNVQLLATVLKDVVPVEKSDLKQKGNWSPRLHYVWDMLLPLLEGEEDQEEETGHVSKKRKKNSKSGSSSSVSEDRSGRILFPEFWQAVVDESFFNEKASNERKYLGFLILEKAVQICSAKHVSVLLSQNIVRCIINQSQNSQRMLNKIANQTLKTITAECEKAPGKVEPLVRVLWFGKNGTINFDKLSKRKFVDTLLTTSTLDKHNLMDLVTLLISQLPEDQSTNEKFNLSRFIFDTLLHLTRAHKARAESRWVKPILSTIVDAAFFNSSENTKLSELAKERLYSILGELINTSVTEGDDTTSWPYIALQTILEKQSSGSTLSTDLDEELKAISNSAVQTLTDIHSKNKKMKNSKLGGLELLLSMAILQLYTGDEESVSILQDLISFHEQSNEESTDLVGITEILLSLVAQRKSLLKRLSLIVWESFVQDIGEPELDVLLQTLTARENKQGFAALFEGEGEGDESDEEEEDDDEEVEEDGLEDEDEDEDMEDDDSSNDDEISSDDASGDLEKIEKETTSALAKALNLPESIVGENGEVQLGQIDDEDDDNDDLSEEEEEESMDDEAMMQLDDQLSQIFKRRKEALNTIPTGNKRKLEVQESRENVISFKHRVVDMLEIYVKSVEQLEDKTEKLQNILMIIMPLLECLKQTLDKSLADKCARLMKLRISKLKIHNNKGSTAEVDAQSLAPAIWDLEEDVHKLMLTSKPGQFQQLFFSTCSLSSLFLAKLYVTYDGPIDELIDLYAETSKVWMKKGKFAVNFFIDFANWLQSKREVKGED